MVRFGRADRATSAPGLPSEADSNAERLRGVMMRRPPERSDRISNDGLRSCTTPRGGCPPDFAVDPVTRRLRPFRPIPGMVRWGQ